MAEWKKWNIPIQEYQFLIFQLINKLPKDKYHYVYGIPRGGTIIAVYMSYQIDLGLIQNGLKGLKPSRVLVVDDIADTGKTLSQYSPLYDTATLLVKPWSSIKPTYYIQKTEDWPVFPYERDDETPNRENPN